MPKETPATQTRITSQERMPEVSGTAQLQWQLQGLSTTAGAEEVPNTKYPVTSPATAIRPWEKSIPLYADDLEIATAQSMHVGASSKAY